MGELNWVYYGLGGGLERPFCTGCHTKSEVKTAFAQPTQHKHIFFLIRRQKLEYQVITWRSLYCSKFVAFVVVVKWGSQNCVSVAGGAPRPKPEHPFSPRYKKSPFGPKKCCLAE